MELWLLISLAALSACAQPGGFCDVVKGPLAFDASTARAIVATDRPTAEAIKVQNDYWRGNCRGL